MALINAPEGFRRAKDVVNIQNNFLQIMSGQTHTGMNKNEVNFLQEAIVNNEIERLIVIAKEFQRQERALFQKFSSKGITDYSMLNKKIEDWNKLIGGNFFFEDSFVQKIVKLMINEQQDDLSSIVQSFINKKLDLKLVLDIMGDGKEDALAKAEDYCVNIIYAGLKGGSSSRKGTLTASFEVEKGSALEKKISSMMKGNQYFHSKGVTFYQKKEKKKDKSLGFEIHFTSDISGSVRGKFIESFSKFYNEENKESKIIAHRSETVDEISQLILSKIPEENTEIKLLVKNILKKELIEVQNYDLNRSTSVIRGSLAEIYWTCFFNFIGLKAKPVGLNLKDIKNRQVPIDLIIEDLGFQVKKYDTFNTSSVFFGLDYGEIKKNEAETLKLNPETVTLKKLFSTQLQLDNEDMESIGRFFISKNYNKPTRDKKYQNEKFEEYKVLYGRFNAAKPEVTIESYVKAHIDKLISTNKDVEMPKDFGFININVGRPTIWLINNNIIPSSIIVEKIIENLKKSLHGENSVFISLKEFTLNLSSFKMNEVWPKKVDIDPAGKMASATGKYLIEVNLESFFNKLLKTLKFS